MEDLTTTSMLVSYTQLAVRKEWEQWLTVVFGSNEDVARLVTFTFHRPCLAQSTWTKPGGLLVRSAASKLDAKLAALGMTWFGVEEEGTVTRRRHLHYLVKWAREREDSGGDKWLRVVRLWWERDFGFTNVKEVVSREAVCMYVVKYVVKSGPSFWTAGGDGWRRTD